MNETNDATTRSTLSGKTLSLKKTETSTVKQSFSHGRSKADRRKERLESEKANKDLDNKRLE
jgi:translation initiation factor IF-2